MKMQAELDNLLQQSRNLGLLIAKVQASVDALPKPMEMKLCEQNFVILKPDQLYIFRYDPSCPSCRKVKDQLEGK